ncbi:MAG TPA: hypothetical protein V6D29_24485 [Leptolyngbyaceae cyanobacterium]
MSKPASAASSRSSTPLIVFAGIAWAIFSLLFFLLFSTPNAEGEKPEWFLLGITFLEAGAFAAASILCLRNWRSSQIVSGRNVWLSFGVGLLLYTLGNVMFFLWGNIWGQDPAVSLGDFFYITSYVCLAIGMFQAVLPRRLNLEPPQWFVILGVGLIGVLLAYFVNYGVTGAPQAKVAPAPLVQLVQNPATPAQPAKPPAQPAKAPAQPAQAPAATPAPEASNAPGWVLQLGQQLEPLESVVGFLYLAGDCLLIVLAATLLVAFWGGRFSQSWKLIAIAAFCLYIADMCFAYAVNQGSYQEGSLWEVFWTFSAIFFGLGAVVEYAISTKSRRSPRRRRA